MNTQFLSVILRILLLAVNRYKYVQSQGFFQTGTFKMTGNSPASKFGNSGSRAQNVQMIQLAISTMITETVCLAATVLALMLRYATYVQPMQGAEYRKAVANKQGSPMTPDPSQNDSSTPNIVPVLISTIQVVDVELGELIQSSRTSTAGAGTERGTPSKNTTKSGRNVSTQSGSHIDSLLKLKMRLMAALGELAFYVSAQDSTNAEQNPSSLPSWKLPVEVWEILVNATLLSSAHEHTDQGIEAAGICRHYATKVWLICYISAV